MALYLKRANAFLANKDYNRARLELKNALQIKPRDAELYYRLGLVELETAGGASAVFAFRRATELNPKHAAAQVKLAEIMAGSRDRGIVEAAEKRLHDVLVTAPDNLDALDVMALTELRLGKLEDAQARLEKTLARFPQHLASAVRLARLALTKKDWSGAEQVLRKAVQSAPQSSPAVLALGQFYLLTGKMDLAEPHVRRAVQLDSKSALALLSLAVLQLAMHDEAGAEQTYKQVSLLREKPYEYIYGMFLFQRGKQQEAIAEFDRLARGNPDDRDARTRLVAAYVAAKQPAQAEGVITNALKRNPKDTDAMLQRGQLYLRTGRATEAENDIKQVLRFRPDWAIAHYTLANIHKHQNRTLLERQELIQTLRLDSSLLPARLRLAGLFIASNEAKAARELMDQAPQAHRNTISVITARNWALVALRDKPAWRAGVNEGLARARTTELILQDGLLRIAERDYAGARVAATEILKQNPGDLSAAQLLAESYTSQQQLSSAVEQIRSLAAKHPESAGMQVLLGRLLNTAGNRAEARNAFSAAKAVNPGEPSAAVALAEVDLIEGKFESARQILTEVVKAHPRHVPALMHLALAHDRSGDGASAISKYRAVVEIDRGNVDALNNLACLLALKNPDEALAYAKEALRADSENAAAQDTLGWLYYRRGLYRSAVEHLKLAVTKDPTPVHQFHLGMSYLKVGDNDLGHRLVRTALKQNPNIPKTEQGW